MSQLLGGGQGEKERGRMKGRKEGRKDLNFKVRECLELIGPHYRVTCIIIVLTINKI